MLARFRFLHRKTVGFALLNLILVLALILSSATAALAANSGANVLPEIRSLLKNQYVDPVATNVLGAPTIEETLKRLGDPHTMYFSPEEYREFLESIDLQFCGIGVQIGMESEGIRVEAVLAHSPAEEVGLQAGDLIVKADNKVLAGLSSEEAMSILRGEEGSKVQLSVERGGEPKIFTVTRRVIQQPTVTGSVLDGHIGYLDLNSFGEDTAAEFETAVKRLKSQDVTSWIVDLRDNGGGYLSAALDIAGYFIGQDVGVCIQDRSGTVRQYAALDHGFTLNQPIIFLVNENSASASELLTAAVKDHQKAIVVGTTTYGKGTVQSMFSLSNGGVLKMTIDRFYSPLGHEINHVGITPDVKIEKADALKAAELMLDDQADALRKAQSPDYWQAWAELEKTAAAAGSQTEPYTLYYPNYRKAADLTDIPLDKKFDLHFSEAVNWQNVNNTVIELINSETGERVPLEFKPLGSAELQVIPAANLAPATTYWLVVHPLLSGLTGRFMSEGEVVVVHTAGSAGESSQVKMAGIQSWQSKESLSELQGMNPHQADYGCTLWDIDTQSVHK